MKKIYIVFDGPRGPFAETIRAGENIMNYIDKYNANIAHICETATQAHYIAELWKEAREND